MESHEQRLLQHVHNTYCVMDVKKEQVSCKNGRWRQGQWFGI